MSCRLQLEMKPYIWTIALRMDEGWNTIQLNLADFTRRAYGTNHVETLGVQIGAFSQRGTPTRIQTVSPNEGSIANNPLIGCQ